MQTQLYRGVFVFLISLTMTAYGTVHYVDLNSAAPVSPYSDWGTAATSIQDAIDSASDGDQILVTNGVYQFGGRAVGALTNRVVMDKAVTVQSVNGPAVTEIGGSGPKGENAVRCAYLTNGAALLGFSLSGGATREDSASDDQNGGAVWCASSDVVISNCFIANNNAGQWGGGVFGGTVVDSVISNNVATKDNWWETAGGGAYGSTLIDCLVITNNSAGGGGLEGCSAKNSTIVQNNSSWGGGVDNSRLHDCVLVGNNAGSGAGAYGSTLTACVIKKSFAEYGAGGELCLMTNCTLANNRTYDYEGPGTGGGASDSTLVNCLVYGNVSSASAGLNNCAGYNCTITSNLTTKVGAAVEGGAMKNSIIYDNDAPDGDYLNSDLSYCCTPTALENGNILDAPLFVDPASENFRLQSNSPCANTGNNNYVVIERDLDNNRRISGGPVDMGAYEFQPPVHYVNWNSSTPVSPYTSWDTAAMTIQDAVDAATPGDEVLVTNGVYSTGGRAIFAEHTNRVAIDKILAVRSVNGAAVTSIEGNPDMNNGPVRCVYMVDDTLLAGFTLTNGTTEAPNDQPAERQSGGGVFCQSTEAMLEACVLVNNTAGSVAGGAYLGTLNHCVLVGNSTTYGGAAWASLMNDCVLSNNVADQGGATLDCTLNDCFLTMNTAGQGGAANRGGLFRCRLVNNSASSGGAVSQAVLDGCTLVDNIAESGGGAESSTLYNCVLSNNVAMSGGVGNGGGGIYCRLSNCVVNGNTADRGGGVSLSTVMDSLLTRNSASYGGGAAESTLTGCQILENSADNGGGAYSSTLETSTIAQNTATNFGGGVCYGSLTRCLVISNTATTGGGAAASEGTISLKNCVVVHNTAFFSAGGVRTGFLVNCTVAENDAPEAGGAQYSLLKNCILYNNNQNYRDSVLTYCCTLPLPGDGFGNFTNAPVFADPDNEDFHLQDSSPCINAGNNSFVDTTEDFDGQTRIVSTMADMGAFEFQSPASAISYAWLLQHGLAIDGSADSTDDDGDGADNLDEWMANTDPADAGSVFKITSIVKDESGVTITWPAQLDRVYNVQRSSSLEPSDFSNVRSDLSTDQGTISVMDDYTEGDGQYFYRVSVRLGPPPPPPDS